MKEISITDISGIKVGHAQDIEGATGCSVVICEKGAAAGVDVRGGAPGTRETDLLNPVNLVEKVHAVVLAGGSAFGLDAAAGVMQYLEEHSIGFDVQVTKVPIVCSAVLFDLTFGDYQKRPDKKMGYAACLNASDKKSPEGNVGAGTGATVGKIMGMERCMKGGLGVYGLQAGELKVAAVVAVNCLGDVIDPNTGKILAGCLSEDGKSFVDTEKLMIQHYKSKKNVFSGNTTIGVVVTNAKFNKTQANKLASIAHNGYARTIRPSHSMFDGDTIFALATGEVDADINVVGVLSAKVVEQAVLRGVTQAKSIKGTKAHVDILG